MAVNKEKKMLKSWEKDFLGHIKVFYETCRLRPRGKGWVRVSGGADSVALLDILYQLHSVPQEELGILHMNHGTRPEENKREERFIVQLAQKYGLPYKCFYAHRPKKQQGGPENWAREERKKAFENSIATGDCLYTAHHLDDSLEWHYLQMAKSSNPLSAPGIPVLNGPYRRPLLCVTKQQLQRYAKSRELSYFQDPSNASLDFERNFVRHEIVAPMAKRFPGLYHHYVQRCNRWARERGVLRFEGPKKQASVYRHHDDLGGILLFLDGDADQWPHHEKFLIRELHRLSNVSRGKLQRQLEKLWRASAAGKMGPLSFSGGTQIFMEKNLLYLCSRDTVQKWKQRDRDLEKKLRSTQIPDWVYFAPEKQALFPFLIVAPAFKKRKKASSCGWRGQHPVLVSATQVLRRRLQERGLQLMRPGHILGYGPKTVSDRLRQELKSPCQG